MGQLGSCIRASVYEFAKVANGNGGVNGNGNHVEERVRREGIFANVAMAPKELAKLEGWDPLKRFSEKVAMAEDGKVEGSATDASMFADSELFIFTQKNKYLLTTHGVLYSKIKFMSKFWVQGED